MRSGCLAGWNKKTGTVRWYLAVPVICCRCSGALINQEIGNPFAAVSGEKLRLGIYYLRNKKSLRHIFQARIQSRHLQIQKLDISSPPLHFQTRKRASTNLQIRNPFATTSFSSAEAGIYESQNLKSLRQHFIFKRRSGHLLILKPEFPLPKRISLIHVMKLQALYINYPPHRRLRRPAYDPSYSPAPRPYTWSWKRRFPCCRSTASR